MHCFLALAHVGLLLGLSQGDCCLDSKAALQRHRSVVVSGPPDNRFKLVWPDRLSHEDREVS